MKYTRNPPEEWDSTGTDLEWVNEADSDLQDQNVQNILQTVSISKSAIPNPLHNESQPLFKFKYENDIKMKNKPDPTLHTKFTSIQIKSVLSLIIVMSTNY
jgi:hypothetical protein